MKSATQEIQYIKEILSLLPDDALIEVRDFAFYLSDRERRRKELEKRVEAAEKEKPIHFDSVEDAVKAVFDETED
jgi:hypothetical protein